MLRSALTAAAVLLALAVPAGAAAAPLVPIVPGITVVVGPCPTGGAYYAGQAGCTWIGATSVYVADPRDRWTKWHELGHQFAFRVLGDTAKPLAGGMRKFAHLTDQRDDGARSASDVREQFADAYAACALGERPAASEWGGGDFPTGNGYDPTRRVHRAVCAMIRRAGARSGL